MRTHEQIITDVGGPTAIARIAGAEAGAAKQWRRNDSIPARYWAAIAAADVASLDELAEAAAAKATPHGEAA